MWFNTFVFFIMLFMHTIADFVLQTTCLSDLKQIKKWNEFTKDMFDEDVEETMYRNDYVAALLTHSFMWAFMTFVPLLLIGQNYWLLILIIVVNSIIHLLIDNIKANFYLISLCKDQCWHINQILISFIIYLLMQNWSIGF